MYYQLLGINNYHRQWSTGTARWDCVIYNKLISLPQCCIFANLLDNFLSVRYVG